MTRHEIISVLFVAVLTGIAFAAMIELEPMNQLYEYIYGETE